MCFFWQSIFSRGMMFLIGPGHRNILEGYRSSIDTEVGVPKWICQRDLEPAADGDQRFITEEQIPDTYLPETILYRRAARIDIAEKK